MFINKNLRLNNSKTKTAMNAKLSIFVFCVEAIIYWLLLNLHDCTFNPHQPTFPCSKSTIETAEIWVRSFEC